MFIYNDNKGRLGNSLFRLFANIVFYIIHNDDNSQINNDFNYNGGYNIIITDNYFIHFMNKFLETGEFEKIDTNSHILFDGFYQHDEIFVKYKEEIVNYIKKNPEFIIKTHGNDSYKAIDFIDYPKIQKKYKIVVHLRLEDFIDISQVIHPNSIKCVIDKLNKEYNNETICFVLNNPKTDIEIKYLQFFTQQYNNIVIETNDVITDFIIMKESTILVCSCSTLSWAAAILSNSLEKVYMPDYKCIHGTHQSCKHPIANTELYQMETCDIIELNKIL